MESIVSVESSLIKELEYNNETHRLIITFSKGSRYQYFNVPLTVWEGFKACESVGKYFHEYIKNQYVTEIITEK